MILDFKMKNINEMVQELIAAGYTQEKIAKAIGIRQPTISEIFNGRQLDMYYMNGGKKLELLYKKMMKG